MNHDQKDCYFSSIYLVCCMEKVKKTEVFDLLEYDLYIMYYILQTL